MGYEIVINQTRDDLSSLVFMVQYFYETFDTIVIGGGPAGMPATISSSFTGRKHFSSKKIENLEKLAELVVVAVSSNNGTLMTYCRRIPKWALSQRLLPV